MPVSVGGGIGYEAFVRSLVVMIRLHVHVSVK